MAGESGGIILFHVYLPLIEFIKTTGSASARINRCGKKVGERGLSWRALLA
jgi:hypothetical protein